MYYFIVLDQCAVRSPDNNRKAKAEVHDTPLQYSKHKNVYTSSVCWLSVAGITDGYCFVQVKVIHDDGAKWWCVNFYIRDHPLFSAFLQEYREYISKRGNSCCTLWNIGLSYCTCTCNKFS